MFTRHIETLITRILARDSRPLEVPRALEQQVIVDCRHFALLLASILRTHGIPAQVRCGFATYLEPTHYQDHWVCEYWDAAQARWVIEDADVQRHDLAPAEFITGGQAWQRCRTDPDQAASFGYGPAMRGMWVARINLVRDIAALNGFECVSGDSWGLASDPHARLSAAELALLDTAAHLAADDARSDDLRACYTASPALSVPAIIQHVDYLAGDTVRMVDWRTAP